MANYGYRGDVNNSISSASIYPGGRTYGLVAPSASRFRVRNNSSGELMSLNQGNMVYAGTRPTVVQGNGAQSQAEPQMSGFLGKPSSWWVMFAVVLVGFIWLARRYDGMNGGGSTMSNIAPTLFNGIVLTFFIVLMLNLLKVFATRFKIPGISELILAA